jgi:ABC-type transport system substrate-binding protein
VPVGYANAEVKALLAAARRAAEDDEAEALYQRAQELIWDDAPWLWLSYQADLHAASRRLRGFRARPDELLMLDGVELG